MAKSVSASNAKSNFGGFLDDVAAPGRVDIVKHGRLVAVVREPLAVEEFTSA
jgi:prevent-host-death family protein